MNRIFAEIYLDEDLDVVVADILKALGFEAVTARDAGRLRATDPEQLAYAASQQMVLLSHNRLDFEALHRQYLAESRDHWGIIIATRRSPQEIVANLLRFLNMLTADELQNQLLYI